MTSLDCADSSQSTPKRNETITALQALSLLNNKFNIAMAEHFAQRVSRDSKQLKGQLRRALRLATGRVPEPEELEKFTNYAEEHGLTNACRLMFNLNAFIFVD